MSQTDSPLKLLVRETIRDIAAWLLKAEVVDTEAINIELTTESPRVDLLFRLWFAGVVANQPCPVANSIICRG